MSVITPIPWCLPIVEAHSSVYIVCGGTSSMSSIDHRMTIYAPLLAPRVSYFLPFTWSPEYITPQKFKSREKKSFFVRRPTVFRACQRSLPRRFFPVKLFRKFFSPTNPILHYTAIYHHTLTVIYAWLFAPPLFKFQNRKTSLPEFFSPVNKIRKKLSKGRNL